MSNMIEYTTHALIFLLGLSLSSVAKDGPKQVQDVWSYFMSFLDTAFQKAISEFRFRFDTTGGTVGSVQEGESLILKK